MMYLLFIKRSIFLIILAITFSFLDLFADKDRIFAGDMGTLKLETSL